MLLSNITKTAKILKTYNFTKDKKFRSITANSKLTNKETLFIFDKNSKSTNKYINEAVKNDVPAIISNKYHKYLNIPQFIVSNIYLETEKILEKIYKLPFKSIAVTGTNGKTSVVWYISNILKLLKYNNTTIGTLGYFRNGKKINDFILTTPAYEELYKYGSSRNNSNIYVFEASSHALAQNRLRQYPIDVAAITNITNDHLDYHKNIFEYKKAKIKLFTNYLKLNGTAVINSRIKQLSSLNKNLLRKKIKKIYFGKKNVFFQKKENFFELNIYKKKYILKKLKLGTAIELENLECAIACCLALKINQNKIIKILPNIKNPPGRLQKIIYKKKNSVIFVDYAHTPDALMRTLKSLKVNNNKPVLVFGCGGDRDKSKRKKMGIIAKNLACKTYITDDNPRNENASKIRKTILKYCPTGIEIPNRRKAIITAIKELENNKILLISGKGHEKEQIIKNKKYKFDDYQIIKDNI